MTQFQNRNRTADLVGLTLKGSKVEAHEPNEIHFNRFRLRCDCGAEFFALTQQIWSRHRHCATLACRDCWKPKWPKSQKVERLPARRCAHGFLGGVDCQECNPDKMCCPACGTVGHEMKLCPNTETGRRRIARLRSLKKAAYESERYKARRGAL